MRLQELRDVNARAEAARPCAEPDYRFRPVSAHDRHLHELKQRHPYFGYVEVEVHGVRPFVMFSNNDDVVAQVYFWFGPDSYESLSLRVWRRLSRASERVLDVGAYTGLFSLVAAFASPDAEVHAFEPDNAAHSRLVMNLAANRLGQRVRVHELAASDRTATETLHSFQGALNLTTGSSLTAKEGKTIERTQEVTTARLDEVIPRDSRSLAVKIDAEEAEDRVVGGIQGLLGNGPASLVIEVSSREMLEDCRQRLPGFAYAVIDDVHHRAMVDDPHLLDERDRHRAGTGGTRRIDPPNVLFHPGGPENLRRWLAPLEKEPWQDAASAQGLRGDRPVDDNGRKVPADEGEPGSGDLSLP